MRFMLLQNYGGVPDGTPPMSEWTPVEIEAHIEAQHVINDELKERGEFVDAQALTSPEQAKFVVSGGASPVVTDGPFAESKELLAGYRTIDVETLERALEVAAQASAAPGPGGTSGVLARSMDGSRA